MLQTFSGPADRGTTTAPARAWLLDPRLDDSFDRLARLSTTLARTPAARIRVATTHALPVRWATTAASRAPLDASSPVWRELELEVARTRRPLPVTDVRERGDAGAACTFGEGLAYLGVPLLGRGMELLGTLAVIDDRPRQWSAEEACGLVELSALAMAEIESRAGAMSSSEQPQASLTDDALAAAPFGDVALEEVGAIWRAAAADERLACDLHELIAGAIHVGSLRVGDRLPSIRRVAHAFGVSSYAVLQAYASLEEEGLVERRERSGIYVAALERSGNPRLPEAASWLVQVIAQACELQLKVPSLPDLIRRWTSAVTIHCACVEQCEDNRVALVQELGQQFGIDAAGVAPAALSGGTATLPETIQGAQLLVTTAYHARQLRSVAERLGVPLLVATANPLSVTAVANRLRQGALTVICADPRFGERVRNFRGGRYRDQIRVVLADDGRTIEALDRAEPVLLTLAARQRLRQPDFRLIAPYTPAFSLDFARKVSEALVRLQFEAERA